LHIKKREIGKDKTIIKVGSRVYVDMEMGCKYLTKKKKSLERGYPKSEKYVYGVAKRFLPKVV
jgi:prefoldin subunit 5